MCRSVRAAIERELHAGHQELQLAIRAADDGHVTISGEVEDIIRKRKLAPVAGQVPGVLRVEDQTRIIPAQRKADGELLDALYAALSSESAFREYAIAGEDGGPNGVRYSSREDAAGVMEILVKDAVATLVGNVQSLTHRRLAEVLAWWTPGIVDVVDQLHVVPPEDDSDDELTDALRIVLEKDPWLDASQITVRTASGRVVLDGLLRTSEQRHMAECDAWYVPGVRSVENRIQVRS